MFFLIPLKRFAIQLFSKFLPTDVVSFQFPVSVKGVCLIDDKVVLVQNEHYEWDLPGGKLRRNESIENCLQREIREELNISVSVEKLVDAVKINIRNVIDVLIVVYICKTANSIGDLKISHESFGLGCFSRQELDTIQLPDNYRTAIQAAFDTTN